MITYRELVELALAQDPGEKVVRASEAFLRTTAFSGLAVTYGPQTQPDHKFLFTHGYKPDALEDLRTNFVPTNIMYRASVRHDSFLTWHDGQFEGSDAAQRWLKPLGYRNGFSVAITDSTLGEIGSVHANSYDPELGDKQLDSAKALADLLGVILSHMFGREEIRLTPRELEVVHYLAHGSSNPDIAEELGVSRRTVATHVENILRKLGTTSRVGIVMECSKRGLV